MLGEMSVFHYLKDPLILKDLKGRLELEASLEWSIQGSLELGSPNNWNISAVNLEILQIL